MIYGIYSIRDVRTGFMTPTMDANDASAARNFHHSVLHSTGILLSYAQDFSLYRLADFDSDSGVITPLTPIVFVTDGAAVKIPGKGGSSDGL